MLHWAALFFIISILAAVFGFGIIAGAAADMAIRVPSGAP